MSTTYRFGHIARVIYKECKRKQLTSPGLHIGSNNTLKIKTVPNHWLEANYGHSAPKDSVCIKLYYQA